MELTKENLKKFINDYLMSPKSLTNDLHQEAEIEGAKEVLIALENTFLWDSKSDLTFPDLTKFITDYSVDVTVYKFNERANQIYNEAAKDVLNELDFEFLWKNGVTDESLLYK